ncbi:MULTISPECIES: hypothetical protein [unclassified Brucella]|uniref:hypothetical protein n=1 Tax=unclassified Brucella TaxID=2632610 RepID=UPI0012AEA166|nr:MULTISPECIES: hypothetical protein [unclassified Brucella]MRN43449.1 hypothetical protein [Brucella sp. 09RB8913]MRN59424.1 hypothetical protein [Brucella sp. 09RB8918]MRN67981.1 hypothetical protein [Brucella sp. 10RB9213]
MANHQDPRIIELHSAISELTNHKSGWVGAKREWFATQDDLIRFLVAPREEAVAILRDRLAAIEAA